MIGVLSEVGLDIEETVSPPVRELDLESFAVVVSLGIHKLGLSRQQVAVMWAIPEFDRIMEDPMRRLRAVRDTLSTRIQALGVLLAAHHSA